MRSKGHKYNEVNDATPREFTQIMFQTHNAKSRDDNAKQGF